jgi:hypothetical protein
MDPSVRERVIEDSEYALRSYPSKRIAAVAMGMDIKKSR